jgi:hypothetical protein
MMTFAIAGPVVPYFLRGRVHYQSVLRRMFPGTDLTILKETPENSSYELTAGQKQMRLHFVIKADNKFLPVSLASMMSKYIRELLMDNINRYFIAHHPTLKPTAGYWTDGLRFIEDLKTHIPHIEYDDSGPIESACKNVVQARMKMAGMRWSRVGAVAMLEVRTALMGDL